ncbi:methionine--tRNA ligase [Hirschia baltica]|uniref:Methionine--tRNA ligase n=1 Tax=Hirschia baltica (strain ATCC 49814 / DSM 5838 / IFAM 1418) TaxID=582402 RepID=C6XLW0_HIRBI|nr:methionine--tRNA ligase [Hirschia baltica]ACT59792.1 methionyl-tRNA synthetase [Hirschia baltica ATCC 49814]
MSRILITSALPYINGVKHLGNLAGSMLPADVYARFKRLKGDDVLYVCATDEHGTPAELAASAAGISVQEYCDEQHEIQRAAGEGFGLSFDWFGRSSREQNAKLTQHFAEKLEANGLIEERTSKQVYSVDDGRFLPDRYVEGTCPHCEFEKARGDQCDNCGRLLDPVDLIEPYSAVSGSKNIEIRDTVHLFLLQEKMQDTIRAWVDEAETWPQLARSIAYKWLDEGLQDRAITRDLKWGVPVLKDGKPRPGFEDKVFYVWFDAPVEYIAATQEWAEAGDNRDWESWWRTDKGADDVSYVQFMGKDNVAFHTVSFPVTIFGSQEPWKTVDKLKAFNWVTWYGGKFSTSQKRGVFMDQALGILPSDYWRWYLIANAPEGSDAPFTWEGFQSAINSDLANVLGNFVNRITKYTVSKFDGVLPDGGVAGEDEAWLEGELKTRLPILMSHYENMEFRKAAAETRAIWAVGNEYLTKAEPWVKFKTDKDAAAVGVRYGLNLVALFGILALPIIPETGKKILDAIGIPEEHRSFKFDDVAAVLTALPIGMPVKAPEVLFSKIEDVHVEEWTEKFGGGK